MNVSEARLSITHRIEKTFLLSFFFKQSDWKGYVLSLPVILHSQHLACGPSSSCTILPCVFICLFSTVAHKCNGETKSHGKTHFNSRHNRINLQSNETSRQNKINSRQNNINSRQNKISSRQNTINSRQNKISSRQNTINSRQNTHYLTAK